MDNPHNAHNKSTLQSINTLTKCQKTIIKDYLIDSNNKLFGIFPSFSPLNPELNLGSRIVDIFSDRFSFNLVNRKKNDKTRFQQPDEIVVATTRHSRTNDLTSSKALSRAIK